MPCCCTIRPEAVKQTKEKAVNSLLVVDSVNDILLQPQNHICEKNAVLNKVLDLCCWDASQPQLAIAECKAMPGLAVLALTSLKVFDACGALQEPSACRMMQGSAGASTAIAKKKVICKRGRDRTYQLKDNRLHVFATCDHSYRACAEGWKMRHGPGRLSRYSGHSLLCRTYSSVFLSQITVQC